MSIATMSARVHALTPQDELIGSLTKERVQLAVRYAGTQASEGAGEARRWLAYALNTEVPDGAFYEVCWAYAESERIEDCDLEVWYDEPNTDANRERFERAAAQTIDNTVEHLTDLLCTQLGVS